MKKIVLMDTLSTIHVGNGALLENTISLCREAFGECEFHIITMDRKTNLQKYPDDKLYNPIFGTFWTGLGPFGKAVWAIRNFLFIFLHIVNECTFKISSEKLTFNKDQEKAIRAIVESKICVSCGGEIIGDAFFQALPFWLFSYWLAIKKGKIFILFPQSVGPLNFKWTRFMVGRALKGASLLVGRDKQSYDTLLSLGFKGDKVMFVPDVAIRQKAGLADGHSYFKDSEKKLIGVTISNPPHQEMGVFVDFVNIICEQLDYLDENLYKILIMPSNYTNEGISRDYALCLRLKKNLGARFETSILENRPYFPDEYSGILSQLELFISTRMHVAILATSMYIPTIAINTQHKIRGYMKNIHMDHLCLDYDELDRISSLMNNIFSERQKIVDQLKIANMKLREEHKVFIHRLKEIAG